MVPWSRSGLVKWSGFQKEVDGIAGVTAVKALIGILIPDLLLVLGIPQYFLHLPVNPVFQFITECPVMKFLVCQIPEFHFRTITQEAFQRYHMVACATIKDGMRSAGIITNHAPDHTTA